MSASGRFYGVAVVVALCLVLIACTAMPKVELPAPRSSVSDHPALGCWALSGVPELGPVGIQPRLVVLDTLNISEDPSGAKFRLVVSESDSARGSPLSYWVPTRDEEIVLDMGTGVSGSQLRMSVRDDSLAGRGYFRTDAMLEGVKTFGGVRGHRVTCSTAS